MKRLLRKTFLRRGFLRLRKIKFLVVLCVTLTVTMTAILAFLAFDEFTFMWWLMQSNKTADEYRQSALEAAGDDWWSTVGGINSNASALGATGLTNMLVNKMQGGYYKEMLEILRDHADWTEMSDAVPETMLNGEPVYPQVQQLLGVMTSEGGLENEGYTRVSPTTVLSGAHYDATDGKHSLATYNSAVCAADGGSTLSSGYYGSLDLYYNGASDVRTNFQFTADYAAIYPSGRYTAVATFYPSKMNGYGISENTERTNTDTDAAYFPDLLSIVLQRSWCRVLNSKTYWDTNAMSTTALNTAMYLPYNYGDAGFAYAWGLGVSSSASGKPFTREGWSGKNTISFQENTSYSVNFFDSIIEESLEKLSADWDAYTGGVWDASAYKYWYGNHADYKGFGVTALLLNGCFVETVNVDKVLTEVTNAGFLRGATVAYRVYTGDTTATKEEVTAWYRNELPVKTVDRSIYGPIDGNSTLIHYFDEEHKIYTDSGNGPYPALRSYGDALRGPWMTRLGGVIIYWKMLQAAGVECTFAEAYQDSIGALTSLAPDNSENSTDSSAKATAAQLARCMAAYSWPTRSQGLGNNGTELYQKVHDVIFPWDSIYMSCDRGVSVAVRWSGADANMPIGSTRDQIKYLDGSDGGTGNTRWQRIYWNGDESKLQPGDILIYSTPVRGTRPPSGNSVGHIILYVGKDIISQIHGSAANGATICHASYYTRSPTCGTLYDDAYYFEAYRLVSPLPKTEYTNAAPYP